MASGKGYGRERAETISSDGWDDGLAPAPPPPPRSSRAGSGGGATSGPQPYNFRRPKEPPRLLLDPDAAVYYAALSYRYWAAGGSIAGGPFNTEQSFPDAVRAFVIGAWGMKQAGPTASRAKELFGMSAKDLPKRVARYVDTIDRQEEEARRSDTRGRKSRTEVSWEL